LKGALGVFGAIRDKRKIIGRTSERKPDSSWAQKGIAKNFRAKEKDVLEMIKRLEAMIMKIAHAKS